MKRGLASLWHVDVRTIARSEDTSYDLLLHLPRRLQVGKALVLCDQPAIQLSVVKKRWMKLVGDLKKQRSSTLDKRKRAVFDRELTRLENCLLTSKERLAAQADALFISPGTEVSSRYHTLYVLIPMTAIDLETYIETLERGGLLVAYTAWQDAYDGVLASRRMPQE